MSFIHDDFLLDSPAARRLYHEHAAAQPIFDYHCHLSSRDIADNRRFENLFEIWLEGDHYKWRAMRAHGVDEAYCTGRAEPYEKFLKWAETVPYCLRNPLYHWTHLELVRYFGITERLDRDTAPWIWETANAKLAEDGLSAQGILARFDVRLVGTTDDPADDLNEHHRIRQAGVRARVIPTFRPDRALEVESPGVFPAWIDRLSAQANVDIQRLTDLLDALARRHEAFHEAGARSSDHGLVHCFADDCTEAEAEAVFERARSGQHVDAASADAYRAFLMRYFAQLNADRGWVMQLHLGARRNANTGAVMRLGRDTGFDSIGDWPQADALGRFLDQLDAEGTLPRTIVYNLNPADNYTFATMIGNFQDGRVAGKMQYGSGWWFLDQEAGMRAQIDALSNVGLLSHFIGMTTDSRSFMSYPRHEYFRRVLCNVIGADVERGRVPAYDDYLARLVADVCAGNAARYFEGN